MNNITGEVIVGFTVTNKGILKNIQVTESSNPVFNDAALEVFKDMPAWNPGKQRGKPVNANVIVPVKFQLDKE